jgi:hypothetical protein
MEWRGEKRWNGVVRRDVMARGEGVACASRGDMPSTGIESPPRIAERMHVQMSEVEATHGIRAHIGMKAKLRSVDGIHTFRSAGQGEGCG